MNKIMYVWGQRFGYDGTEWILARVDTKKAALISLKNGNRWNDPVPVADSGGVSLEELRKTMGTRPNEFKSIDGPIYPPEKAPATVNIGSVLGTVDKEGTWKARDYADYDMTKDFILNEFIPAWENRNKQGKITLKVRDSVFDPYMVSDTTLEEVENKLNDGRKLRSGTSLNSLLTWREQPEGRAYWAMANSIFEVDGKSTQKVGRITIRPDGVKAGCKTVSESLVEQFIKDYRAAIQTELDPERTRDWASDVW